MQARAISDGFLEARSKPDYRVHAATRYLRAFDYGMTAISYIMSAWYTRAVYGLQGQSGAVAAAWIVTTWCWFFEAAFQHAGGRVGDYDRLQGEAERYHSVAWGGLAWSQLAIASTYLLGGFEWHVPVHLGSFIDCAGSAGGYFWLAVLGWCVQVELGVAGPPHMARTQRYLSVFYGVGTFVDRSWAAVAVCDVWVTAFLTIAVCFARGLIVQQRPEISVYASVIALTIARQNLIPAACSTKHLVAVDLIIGAANVYLSAWHARVFIAGEHDWRRWAMAALSLLTGLRGLDAVRIIVETMGWGWVRKTAATGDDATALGGCTPSASRPKTPYLCGWCGAAGAGKRCAGCDEADPAHYCGKLCQEQHWSNEEDPHKAHCRGRRRRRAHDGGGAPTPSAA